eukprot:3166839-Rhodomonas_salina.3
MNDPDETSVTDSDNRVDMSKVLRKFRARQILPDGVEQEVVDMVRIARVQLAKEEIRAVEEDGIGGEEALASAARTAISETARKNLQEEQAVQEQARARVTEDASPLAIFNHEAHFLWHSDAARAAEPPLESALRSPASESGLWTGMIRILEHAGCRLRSGSATVPIWIWSRIWWRCVAICKRRKIAGAGQATDSAGAMLCDMTPTRCHFATCECDRPCDLCTVLAESGLGSQSSRVCAVDGASCKIHAYAAGRARETGGAGVASAAETFPGSVRAVQKQLSFGLTRCGETLVGAGGDDALHIWRIPDAMSALAAQAATIGNRRQKTGRTWMRTGRRRCRKGRGSRRCSRQRASGSRSAVRAAMCSAWELCVAVGCASGDAPAGAIACPALRVVDIDAQRVVSVLAGHREAPAMFRQYCAESRQLFFTMDARTSLALVFYLRSSAPAFVPPDCGCGFAGALSRSRV